MPTRSSYQAAAEIAQRKYDGLDMFRALPQQVDVLESVARELLVSGSNRSGKSLILSTRFAAIARGKTIKSVDGREFNPRLPHQRGKPLLMWVIGEHWDDIGDTIYRLLLQPGEYKIIRDEDSLQWRAYNPYFDKERVAECRPSWPLIPESEIIGGFAGIGWEERKGHKFKRFTLKNGTTIRAFASTGTVKKSDPVDEIWVDERFDNSSHYAEWQARLVDNDGRITLSTINYADPALFEIRQRAEEQAQEIADGEREEATVRCIDLFIHDNPHLDKESIAKLEEGLTEEQRKLRIDGKPIIDSLIIYQDFTRSIHTAIYPNPEMDDEISRILRERNGQPPADWTREFVLDPGTLRPYGLLGAIPPPTLWDDDLPTLVVYDEVYEPRLDADGMAKHVKAKLGTYSLHRMIIDGKAGAQTPLGYAKSIQQNYTEAFAREGIVPTSAGVTMFVPGDPNFEARSKRVEHSLLLRKCGRPQLRIVIDRCMGLVRQLEGNLYQTVKAITGEQLPTKKPARQKDDAREGLEYWISRSPTWVRPPVTAVSDKPQWKLYKSLEARFKNKQRQSNIVHIGSGDAS